MKTTKRKNKSAFNVIILYGGVAVGKYTVAKEFQKVTGYKFFHNHHTYDLADSLFKVGTLDFDRLVENLRIEIFKAIGRAKLSAVTTHTYSSGFVSKTGTTDPEFVKKIERIILQAGGNPYFIHLHAKPEVLMKRVKGKSRRKFRKLKDPKTMKELLKQKDWWTSAPVKNNIEIENTHLSPKQVVSKLKTLIKI